jgi:micrococcal nuclease
MTEKDLNSKLYWYKAECTRVIDGDTMEFIVDLGMKTFVKDRVRLFGIDTPEIFGVKKESEEYAQGVRAKRRAEELLASGDIWIKTVKDKEGKYGRYLAEVKIVQSDESVISLNETLVAEELASPKIY